MSSPIIPVKICDGAEGCYIENNRFKNTRISLNILLPLTHETVSKNAILPFLLRRACREFPDFQALNARLAELYGAYLAADAVKLGDIQVLRLVISALDDRFALEKEEIGKECASLLCSLVFDPPFINGSFNEDDFKSEQRLFIERIEGEINDKRRYAVSRCESIMCADEPFGITKYGSLESAKMLTSKDVFDAWKNALQSAHFRINIVGKTNPTPIFDRFGKAFSELKRDIPKKLENSVIRKAGKLKEVVERLDISQGKLCIGFRAGTAAPDINTTAARVMVDMFGGGPYSKLFLNVREKLSLCYYCAARYNMRKGLILVDSGVEFENREKALSEILNQLDLLKKGDFSEDDLNASKISLINTAKTISDSASDLDIWYLDRFFSENPESPNDFAEEVSKISREDVISAASKVSIDTVYSLLGLEETK